MKIELNTKLNIHVKQTTMGCKTICFRCLEDNLICIDENASEKKVQLICRCGAIFNIEEDDD